MNREWLLALVPLVLGAVFFAIGFTLLRRTRILRRTGATAHGQVIRLQTSSGENGILYHPVVAWTAIDGRTVEATAPIGKSWISGFRPGRAVVVHYDPRDPARMSIDGYSGGVEWLFCVIGAGLFIGTVAVLAFVVL